LRPNIANANITEDFQNRFTDAEYRGDLLGHTSKCVSCCSCYIR